MRPVSKTKAMAGWNRAGFTLVEMLVALAVFSVVIGLAVNYFSTQQSTLTGIDQRSQMTINARGAMYLVEAHIRLMGFSPRENMSAGEALDPGQGCLAGPGHLTFRRRDPGDISKINTISIGLKKADDKEGGVQDGFADAHDAASALVIQGGQVADNVKAIRFAYAFDADGDGSLDLSPNDNILWAIDSSGDGRLDTLLDTNDDGLIDRHDIPGGDSMTNPVDISAIRAVKVWLLVRSSHPLRGRGVDNRTFYVGGQPYTPGNRYGHTLYTTTIRCRNMKNR